jgi:hypothetical protein
MNWQPDRDGWLFRQQQFGEPGALPGQSYAFVSRGLWFARGAEIAAAVDAHCAALELQRHAPPLALPLAA